MLAALAAGRTAAPSIGPSQPRQLLLQQVVLLDL